ncbi:hypothetical protein BU17DRAFT_85849 [Hysterangium stoloniferum]|nr:hypothetical protein BU17DRAFT_85849 [Hysterangium stoloniferum]
MSPITEQPLPSSRTMNSAVRPEDCEKDTRHRHSHQACHSVRLRRLLVPALAIFLTAAALLFFEIGDMASGGNIGVGSGLLRRAGDGSTNSDTPFVKNKLYLIVVIVGLVLLLFAAIALSAWCCKGSFRNPYDFVALVTFVHVAAALLVLNA